MEEIEFWDKFKKENNIIDEPSDNSTHRPRTQVLIRIIRIFIVRKSKALKIFLKMKIRTIIFQLSEETFKKLQRNLCLYGSNCIIWIKTNWWMLLNVKLLNKIFSDMFIKAENVLFHSMVLIIELGLPPFFAMLTGPTISPYRYLKSIFLTAQNGRVQFDSRKKHK